MSKKIKVEVNRKKYEKMIKKMRKELSLSAMLEIGATFVLDFEAALELEAALEEQP